MIGKIPNRPAGGRESDFSELNDWTITDIATTPKTAPEDRQNAEAEIARREKAGTYNLDKAPQEVRSDLISHGYGVENGKVLYPKPEYKSWLESDRSEPFPHGIIRESIEDRLEAERQKATEAREAMNAERRRARDLAVGQVAIEQFENAPTGARIGRSYKNGEGARKRKAGKEASIEMASRRKMKELNKYDNNFLNPEKTAAAEAKANLPLVEVANQPTERVRSPESVEVRAEKLYNFYAENFSKNAPRWISFGVSSLLEKGTIDSPTDSLLKSGFWAREEDRVHERIDPDNVLSVETLDAEADLEKRVSRDLIEKRAETVPEDDLRNAKRDGLLYAIYSGARIDDRSGEIVYSIPSERGEEVVEFMQKNGLDPNSEKLQLASHDGFIGVVEAIKNDKKATEKGFKALDWYFETFNYANRFDESNGFLDVVRGYQSISDLAFSNKLEEYLLTRPEYQQYLKESEAVEQEIESIERSELITDEEYREEIAKTLGCSEEDLKDAEISANYILGKTLPPEPNKLAITGHGGNSIRYPKKFGEQKKLALYAVFTLLKKTGRDYQAEIYRDKIGREKYTILRFGCADDKGYHENHAIAEGDRPASATYIWHGQGDGWQTELINTYKSVAKANPNVSAKNHNHNESPVEHMIKIMSGLGIDLLALATQALDQSSDSIDKTTA